jgi:molybdopterin converting factor subunit 1
MHTLIRLQVNDSCKNYVQSFTKSIFHAVSLSMSKTVSVLLFGITREIVGTSSLAVTVPPSGEIGDLLDSLKERYPALSGLRSLLIAVNGEYAELSTKITTKDEIALIPPVSGG